MPRNIAEIFSPAFGRIGVISVRYYLPLSDLVISHLRLYSVVLCLSVSFCYRAAVTVATGISPLLSFSSGFVNAPVRRGYFGYAKLLTGSAM